MLLFSWNMLQSMLLNMLINIVLLIIYVNKYVIIYVIKYVIKCEKGYMFWGPMDITSTEMWKRWKKPL